MAYYADECPKCACWVDMESIVYVRVAFFAIFFLTVFGLYWILNGDVEVPAKKPAPSATTTILAPPRHYPAVMCSNMNSTVACVFNTEPTFCGPGFPYVCSGVRPSPGAATPEQDLVFEPFNMLEKAELAVAEDGHTPLHK
jgi:hypothetical protein